MKKTLTILGGIFVAVILVGVVMIAIAAVKGTALDKESREYLDEAIPAIVGKWDIKEIQKRASPEFNEAVKPEDLEKLMRVFRRLGSLKSYNGAKGDSTISITSQHGKVISATYIARADFSNGPAEITMSLIKHGDQWQLLGIHVDSEVFLEER